MRRRFGDLAWTVECYRGLTAEIEDFMRTMTHTYTGPTTTWGLKARSACRVVGARAGGIRIVTLDGRCWLVGRHELVPRRQPVSARERISRFVRAA